MGRIIRGTGDAKRVVLKQGAPGGQRKLRCTQCSSGYAVPATKPNGTKVLRCQCGAEYTSAPM
jgi:hypothetical protein